MNFGFNLSEKVKTDGIVNGTDSQDLVGYKTLNLFPFLAAEYKITDKIFVDARYNFNFFDMHKNGFETKIGFLQAGLGYDLIQHTEKLKRFLFYLEYLLKGS
ncbi:hypothetical protein [Chryseobacterium indoltheticum]|uniref:hypothetical protein n=1 Tax=Chryseobacterium indoltheticum TaxID=254 RepID=UPI003F49357C